MNQIFSFLLILLCVALMTFSCEEEVIDPPSTENCCMELESLKQKYIIAIAERDSWELNFKKMDTIRMEGVEDRKRLLIQLKLNQIDLFVCRDSVNNCFNQ